MQFDASTARTPAYSTKRRNCDASVVAELVGKLVVKRIFHVFKIDVFFRQLMKAREIINFDLNDEGDLRYKLIVFNELYFIRQNSEKIEKTAKNLYKAKKNQVHEPTFKQTILNVTLDFSKLEELCNNYRGF